MEKGPVTGAPTSLLMATVGDVVSASTVADWRRLGARAVTVPDRGRSVNCCPPGPPVRVAVAGWVPSTSTTHVMRTAGGWVAGLRRPGRDVSTVTVPEAAGAIVAV